MIAVGSSFRVSTVDRAVTPKPLRQKVNHKIVDLHRRKTYERYIIHAKYDHTLVFRRVLRNATQVRFEDMISVQERHLAIRLNPHLYHKIRYISQRKQRKTTDFVLRILRKVVQSCDMQLELATF